MVSPTDPTDPPPEDAAEQRRIAASLTNGTLYKSGGAFGARKGAKAGRTRIEIDAYPLGLGPDEDIQFAVHTWEPGLVTASSFDYGDGSSAERGPGLWRCDQENRPVPLKAGWLDHHYEPGRYKLRASVTTGSCDGFAETGDLSDVHTVEASLEFEITRERVIHVVY